MGGHLVGQPLFRRFLVGGVIVAALFALFSLPDSTVHADGSFNTTTEYFFCNQLPTDFTGPAVLRGDPNCTSDYSPNANPNFGFTWTVPSGDYNFSTFANWMSDEFSIAADEEIDDGTVIGGIGTDLRFGLTANPCNNAMPLDFILYDSTTDTSDTVDALPEGWPDRFSNLKIDGGDGFPSQADANSPAVLHYPSFLNTLLDPDLDYPGGPNGDTPPISPHARYTGLTKVTGADWLFLTVLVFQKDQLLAFTNDPDNAMHPFARYGRNPDDAGWVHILVLQDPMELVVSISALSDFCTPLTTNAMFLGQVTDTNHGTVNRLTSPAAGTGIDGEGTHPLLLYALTIRDADGDGIENSFDTCPFTANVEDPRSESGPDFDMLDSACDPHADEYEDDEDGDGFLNPQDNCPLVANATQAQGEMTTTYIQAAPDGGFKHDSIGNACDSEQGGNDNVADGAFRHDMNTDAVCIGGVDTTPPDGFCDAGGLSASTIDTDGDAHPNDNELIIGTDPLVDCPLVPGSHDAWPADFDMNRIINLGDVFPVLPPTFGTSTGQPGFSARADLMPDGIINLGDVFPVLPPTFGTNCTP